VILKTDKSTNKQTTEAKNIISLVKIIRQSQSNHSTT